MQLPSKTVRDRMLTLTVDLKEEMIRASAKSNSNSPATTPKLQSTFKKNRKRTTSNVSSKIGDFLTLRRSKSSQSLSSKSNGSNGSSKGKNIKYSDNPQPTTENYLLPSPITSASKKPIRPKHSRSQSATSILLKSLGITSSPTTEKELGWETTTNAKEDPAWWAVRLRSTKCSYAVKQGKIGTDLKVEELAILRARLRAESPR